MDYKEILDDILELDKSITVIKGFGDVILCISEPSMGSYLFKDIKEDNFWVIMGRGNSDMIIDALSEYELDVDRDGEWEFSAVLKWVPGEYDECGRCTMRDYLYVEHIELNFIQSFKQRERQLKLDEILSNELEDLFK